jgi:hypothetical protein
MPLASGDYGQENESEGDGNGGRGRFTHRSAQTRPIVEEFEIGKG